MYMDRNFTNKVQKRQKERSLIMEETNKKTNSSKKIIKLVKLALGLSHQFNTSIQPL